MKKLLKETIPLFLIEKGKPLFMILIMMVSSLMIYNNLVISEENHELKEQEIIEINKNLVKQTSFNIKSTKEEIEEEPKIIEETEKVELIENEVEPSVEPVVETNIELGKEIANYASQFVGIPYVYGGSSLNSGTDCSGFTMAIYSNFGISLPHTATGQSNLGREISLDSLQPGDLIFYGYDSITHAALYIGNGQIIHAMNESMGVNISSYDFMPIIKAIRII